MQRARSAFVLVLSVALLAMGTTVPSGAATDVPLPAALDPEVLTGRSPRAIVGFRHDVTPQTIRRLSAAGMTHAVVLDTIDAVGVLGPRAAYVEIARWSDVEYVDSDSPLRMANYEAKVDTKVTHVRSGKRPLRRAYTGEGVTVAVVDTGIDSTHPDLADRVARHVNFEPGWFFDMINDGVYSDRVAEATGNPVDSYGHGTHVAGIVAGTGEAAAGGLDMSGVAPAATIVDLKIADIHQGVTCSIPCDFGWEMNALVAFEWMIENRNDPEFPGGIRVSNNSWSTYEVDSEVEPITMITQAAVRKGITVVFAAGNDGPEPDTVSQGPNALPEVITVAAACKSEDYETEDCQEENGDGMAYFSSRGKEVDIAAPGFIVWSARGGAFGFLSDELPAPPAEDDPAAMVQNAAWYVALSGTSMASPHVAGIVALMLEANPKLTPARIQSILKSTATDRGAKGFDETWGRGLVNAHRAVVAAAPRRR